MKFVCVAALTTTIATIAPAQAEPSSPKSETTALALSLGGTVASVGVAAYGFANMIDGHEESSSVGLWAGGLLSLVITPSLGHIYAGDGMTNGLALRAGGAAVAVVGFFQWARCTDENCGFLEGGHPTLLVGGGLAAAGVIWDIATARKAARRTNEKRLSLVPAAAGAKVGLSLAGSF